MIPDPLVQSLHRLGYRRMGEPPFVQWLGPTGLLWESHLLACYERNPSMVLHDLAVLAKADEDVLVHGDLSELWVWVNGGGYW